MSALHKADIFWQGHLAADCLVIMQGDTPLHAAAQHAGAAVVKLLLDNACNPVAQNLLVSCAAVAVFIWN